MVPGHTRGSSPRARMRLGCRPGQDLVEAFCWDPHGKDFHLEIKVHRGSDFAMLQVEAANIDYHMNALSHKDIYISVHEYISPQGHWFTNIVLWGGKRFTGGNRLYNHQYYALCVMSGAAAATQGP